MSAFCNRFARFFTEKCLSSARFGRALADRHARDSGSRAFVILWFMINDNVSNLNWSTQSRRRKRMEFYEWRIVFEPKNRFSGDSHSFSGELLRWLHSSAWGLGSFEFH